MISSLIWTRTPGELHLAQAATVEKLGHRHSFFRPEEQIPPGTRIVLVQGSYGTLLPTVRQLLSRSPEKRPVLAYWFQQSLSLMGPDWVSHALSLAFVESVTSILE